MCVRVIMTVGTSLVVNTGGCRQAADFNDLNNACGWLARHAQPRTAINYAPDQQAVLDELKRLSVAPQVGHRTSREPDQTDRLPQELSYLYLLLAEKMQHAMGIEVKLLASSSALGTACAEIIRDFLKCDGVRARPAEPWGRIGSVCLKVVEGLQAEEPGKFEQEGAPNLITTIRDLAQGAPEGWGVIINPTGGFKELIPYATIATAFIERPFEMHYLFAESDEITVLPPYPIGLNFPLWSGQEALRQAAAESGSYAEKLDFRMRSVKATKGPATGAIEVFEKAYEHQAKTDTFENLSKRVIDDLLAPGEYRQRLCGLLDSVGSQIWLGDKIPLMAGEHAARHHQSLFETAQLLLSPMLDAEPDFLNQKERFVLLAGVLLHDCGHSMEALPDKRSQTLVRLFPTEVRDLHNYLAWHRLTTKSSAEAIGWNPHAELAREVAWLCVYHRHHTGWGSVNDVFGQGYCPYLEKRTVPPLQAREKYQLDSQVDLPKLVVLLRLIDGCDNQSRRVGPPARTEVLQKLLEQEKQVYMRQLEEAVVAALAYAGDQCCLPGMDLVLKCRKWLDTPPEARNKPPKFDRGLRRGFATPDGDPVWARLWTAVARATDEITMRDRQLFHFVKHQVVRRVLIHPDHRFDGQEWSFAATLEEDADFEVDGYGGPLDSQDFASDFASDLDHSKCHKPELRRWLLYELAREIGNPRTGESPELRYLAARAGRAFRFSFRWKDADDAQAIIVSSEKP